MFPTLGTRGPAPGFCRSHSILQPPPPPVHGPAPAPASLPRYLLFIFLALPGLAQADNKSGQPGRDSPGRAAASSPIAGICRPGSAGGALCHCSVSPRTGEPTAGQRQRLGWAGGAAQPLQHRGAETTNIHQRQALRFDPSLHGAREAHCLSSTPRAASGAGSPEMFCLPVE